MKTNPSLPDHFFKRELLLLPLKAGNENLTGAGTLQHRDSRTLNTINYRAKDYSGVLLLRGKGFYEEDGKVTPLERGSFFQRFPGRLHSTYPDIRGRWSEFYITLPGSLSTALMETGYIDGGTAATKTVIDEELVETITSIKKHFRNRDQLEAAAIMPLIMKFLYLVRRPEADDKIVADSEMEEEQFMQLLHNRLRSHASYALDFREFCSEQGMGYERFRKKFRKERGIPPGLYAARYRIDEACRRISRSHMSIKEIALDLGYPDLATFSRQFSRIKGVSPRHWISACQNR